MNKFRNVISVLGGLPVLIVKISYKIAFAFLFHTWRLCVGFGEYPSRILFVIPILFIVTWMAYWQLGTFILETTDGSHSTGRPLWDDALYYSLISFTALGYGGWSPEPAGWAKWVGAVQPFIGIFTAVIFSISVARLFQKSKRD